MPEANLKAPSSLPQNITAKVPEDFDGILIKVPACIILYTKLPRHHLVVCNSL